MNLTKETEMWFANHIQHRKACSTIFWFLKGRRDLIDIMWFAVIATQEKIAKNVSSNNALFDHYCMKK